MNSKVLIVVAALIVSMPLTLDAERYNSTASPHPDTAICMALGDTNCEGLCTYCHAEPSPSDSFFSQLHRDGDVEICNRCHESETVLDNARGLVGTSGGNHPSQIVYDATMKQGYKVPGKAVLYCGKDDPANPSLPWTCKILCSTCHDVHSGAPYMLKVSNSNSALCYDCHER